MCTWATVVMAGTSIASSIGFTLVTWLKYRRTKKQATDSLSLGSCHHLSAHGVDAHVHSQHMALMHRCSGPRILRFQDARDPSEGFVIWLVPTSWVGILQSSKVLEVKNKGNSSCIVAPWKS